MVSSPALWNRINAVQFDRPDCSFPFSRRLARDNGWKYVDALSAIEEYRKFRALYQNTLQAYVRESGKRPPPRFWPPADVRFSIGKPTHPRVDAIKTLLFRARHSLLRPISLLTGGLMLLIGISSMASAQGPFSGDTTWYAMTNAVFHIANRHFLEAGAVIAGIGFLCYRLFWSSGTGTNGQGDGCSNGCAGNSGCSSGCAGGD